MGIIFAPINPPKHYQPDWDWAERQYWCNQETGNTYVLVNKGRWTRIPESDECKRVREIMGYKVEDRG